MMSMGFPNQQPDNLFLNFLIAATSAIPGELDFCLASGSGKGCDRPSEV